jgi:glyoxylase-like metal-dependent hydrolase (beta-lactamase superfamily II)
MIRTPLDDLSGPSGWYEADPLGTPATLSGLPRGASVGSLRLEVVVSMPFAENTWVVFDERGGGCLIVDPGFQPGKVLRVIERFQLTPEAILNTHGHVDHIAGNAAMKEAFPDSPLIIGRGDAFMLTDPEGNLSVLSGQEIVSPPADRTVRDLEAVELLGRSWRVREIPGHSPGHVVFHLADHDPPIVLGGDVLFAGGIGRSDFPGGDHELLLRGIREKLYSLPDDTIVYPGHGETTTIADERATNPFVRG